MCPEEPARPSAVLLLTNNIINCWTNCQATGQAVGNIIHINELINC